MKSLTKKKFILGFMVYIFIVFCLYGKALSNDDMNIKVEEQFEDYSGEESDLEMEEHGESNVGREISEDSNEMKMHEEDTPGEEIGESEEEMKNHEEWNRDRKIQENDEEINMHKSENVGREIGETDEEMEEHAEPGASQ